MESNKIFMFVGPSGCGKTTLVNKLKDDLGLSVVNSYTERQRRTKNEGGHTFLTSEEFDKIPQEDFVAYTVFDGYRYGVTSDMIDSNDLYVIDVDGVKYFKNHYKGNKIPVVFFINIPEPTAYKQMLERGDSQQAAIARIRHDKVAFSGAWEIADYIIPYVDYDFIKQIITSEMKNV